MLSPAQECDSDVACRRMWNGIEAIRLHHRFADKITSRFTCVIPEVSAIWFTSISALHGVRVMQLIDTVIVTGHYTKSSFFSHQSPNEHGSHEAEEEETWARRPIKLISFTKLRIDIEWPPNQTNPKWEKIEKKKSKMRFSTLQQIVLCVPYEWFNSHFAAAPIRFSIWNSIFYILYTLWLWSIPACVLVLGGRWNIIPRDTDDRENDISRVCLSACSVYASSQNHNT